MKRAASERNRDADLSTLAHAVAATYENAQNLFHEGVVLRANGAFARALFLHQISMEECGKIEILGATAVSILAGYRTDLKGVAATLSKHKAKNFANAYMLPQTPEEKDAIDSGDWEQALESFKRIQADFHLYSNTAKNASLYVDFHDGRLRVPKETIQEEMVEARAELNREFLEFAEPKVRMVQRWKNDTDEVQRMIAWFIARAEELRAKATMNPRSIISVLLTEMRSRAEQTRYSEVVLDADKSDQVAELGPNTDRETE